MTDYNDEIINMVITEINGDKFLLIEQKNNVIYIPEFKFKQFIKGVEYLIAGLEADNV
jgi:hypothetical protein